MNTGIRVDGSRSHPTINHNNHNLNRSARPHTRRRFDISSASLSPTTTTLSIGFISTSMSSNHKKKRGVRFTEETIANERTTTTTTDSGDQHEPARHKRPRWDRPNADELDDIDEYVNEEEEDDNDDIPSETATLRAKRERRLKQAHDDDEREDDTHIDQDTSLAAEGIAIEPFHMREESTDGTGYFDGDTYVFRKGGGAEEPDAWLDSIAERGEDEIVESAAASSRANDEDSDNDNEAGNKMDNWTNQELYAQIIPLVSDSETVMQAIARYGKLIRNKKEQESTALAKKALNDLTEASSALLLNGQHDIYQKTRQQLSELLPTKKEPNNKPVVQWEYQGSQDQQVHGPYTTQQMQGWIQQGYFVGPTAVMIRSIRQEPVAGASIKDDLLNDLMDDEDEDDNETIAKKPAATILIKGEWTKSDKVDFSQYA